MNRTWMAGLAVLALVATRGAPAQDKPPPEKAEAAQTVKEKIESVRAEYQKAMTDFSTAYGQAKTNEERSKLFQAKYPNPSKYAARLLELAESAPEDPAAVDALVFCVQQGRGSDAGRKAVALLAKSHASNPKVGLLAGSLAFNAPAPDAETLLKALAEKGADRASKGQATLGLGKFYNRCAELASMFKDNPGRVEQVKPFLKAEGLDEAALKRFLDTDPDTFAKQAEGYFDRVVKDYADVSSGRMTLGKAAEGELNEIRNLGIGRPCPEIVGKDIDDKEFQLSDFKGKVVVDFWGDW